MKLTVEQLKAILTENPHAGDWVDALNNNLEAANINTPHRIAAFLAQTAHESTDYTHLSENLNYGAKGLLGTWPKRFDAVTAAAYARQPEKIANKVYALRLGNGDEKSGDGWKYRGRGIIQVTGKNNYGSCSVAIYKDTRLLENPDILSTDKDAAIKSACWYWTVNDLNTLADNQKITEMTKKINGGYLGLEERIAKFNLANKVLGGE